MSVVLYVILIALCLAILAEGMRDPPRIYQFPFGAAAVFLGFIVPPLFGRLTAADLPKWSLGRYLFMSVLCLGACWLGDLWARRRRVQWRPPRPVNTKAWLIGAGVLVIVGGLAHLQNRAAFEAGFDPSTGKMVAVGFFVTLLRYGFIMAVLVLVKSRNRYALALAILAGFFYMDRIVLLGRRKDTVECAFILAGSVWLVWRRALPRPVVAAALIIAPLLIVSTGFYRSVAVSRTGERDWSRLKEIDPVGNMVNVIAEGSSETVAGVHLLSAMAEEGVHDYGLRHWNLLVFNYVPAQVFGSKFKQSLSLAIPEAGEVSQRRYGYTPNTGSTVTGVVDAYASFWYLGALKFFAIAFVMQWLYRHAARGNMIIQCIYLYMMPMALHTITHHTHWFLSPWVHISVFWLPVMCYASKTGRFRPKRPSGERFNAHRHHVSPSRPIPSRASARGQRHGARHRVGVVR